MFNIHPNRRGLVTLTFISTLFLISLIGCAENYNVPRYNETNNKYYLSGDLNLHTYESIIQIVEKNKDKKITLVVDSLGGYVSGIEDAMDAIHAHGEVSWIVRSRCYSACALLGIAASRIDGTLYFHSINAGYGNTSYMSLTRNDHIIKKLISYGYNKNFAEKLMSSINIQTKLEFHDGRLLNSSND